MGVAKLGAVACECDDFASHRCRCVEVKEASQAVDDVEKRRARVDHAKKLEFWAVRQNFVFELVFVVLSCLGLPSKLLLGGCRRVVCNDRR